MLCPLVDRNSNRTALREGRFDCTSLNPTQPLTVHDHNQVWLWPPSAPLLCSPLLAGTRHLFNVSTSPRPPPAPEVFIMNKLANMRHWSDRMAPGFGMSRPNPNNMSMPAMTPQHKPVHGSPISPTSEQATIHYSFNVPFASDLAGPNTEDILYATTGAVERWTHPEDAPDDVPIYELPVHAQNVINLRRLCKDLSSGPLPIEAHVKSSEPKRVKGQVTNVCLSGSPDLVHKSREAILNETPLALVRLAPFMRGLKLIYIIALCCG